MIIRHEDWKRISGHFTEVEKARLREAVTGETICPRGCTVDEGQVSDLLSKIRKLLEAL
jgi:hypothetical protein